MLIAGKNQTATLPAHVLECLLCHLPSCCFINDLKAEIVGHEEVLKWLSDTSQTFAKKMKCTERKKHQGGQWGTKCSIFWFIWPSPSWAPKRNKAALLVLCKLVIHKLQNCVDYVQCLLIYIKKSVYFTLNTFFALFRRKTAVQIVRVLSDPSILHAHSLTSLITNSLEKNELGKNLLEKVIAY